MTHNAGMLIFCKYTEFHRFNLLSILSSAANVSVCCYFIEGLGVLQKVQLIL